MFQSALRRDDGRAAADYVQRRGLSDAMVSTYRLGYAPRAGLRTALAARGFTDEDMLAAGVIRRSERDGELFDYFRDRVMFPIEDPGPGDCLWRGPLVTQPKYLNSGEGPATKKCSLWLGAGTGGAEGNLPRSWPKDMDVIAIQQSGVATAVAPLAPHSPKSRSVCYGSFTTNPCRWR